MPHSSTTVRSVGVDTLTCSAEWKADGGELVDVAKALQLAEAASGSKVTPFHRAVYKGWQTQHIGWASHEGRVLVELRGKSAYDWWDVVLPMADKVSRIDVQVSVYQQPYDHDMALRIYLGERERAKQRGRPSQFRMQGESDGGTTLYLGRGSSRYEARLYERFYKTHDKAEKDVWRYEVQCRRERARQVADALRGAGDIRPLVQDQVYHHFVQRGVDPIFDPAADNRLASLPPPQTDRAKSLRWLGSSVAPALARHVAWGSYQDALAALGIPQTLEPS